MCFFNSGCGCTRERTYIGIPGPQGPAGPAGPIGPQGATGPQGPAGTIPNQNATIYNTALQTLTSGTALDFPTVLTNNNVTVSTTSVTIPTTGTYIISYNINRATTESTTDNVGIAINGTINTATQSTLSTTSNTSASYILNLTSGDIITVVPTIADTNSITNNGGPSSSLTVVRIA